MALVLSILVYPSALRCPEAITLTIFVQKQENHLVSLAGFFYIATNTYTIWPTHHLFVRFQSMPAIYRIHINVGISNKLKVCNVMLLGLPLKVITHRILGVLQI